MAFKKIEPVHTNQVGWIGKLKTKRWLMWLVGIVGMLILVGGMITAYSVYKANETAHAVEETFNTASKQKMKQSDLVTKPNSLGKYAYGAENDGVPNAQQLKQYLKEDATLSTYGLLAAPAQKGLKNRIKTMPINEGVSNAVLARGIGIVTDRVPYVMGKGPNIYAGHNWGGTTLYGNYVLGLSPLQEVDVSKQPVGYTTNGKQIFKFKMTEKHTIDVVDDPTAYQRMVDDAKKENKVMLVTCDEPRYGFVNLRPTKRIIVSGPHMGSQNFKDAPKEVQAQFKQLQQ